MQSRCKWCVICVISFDVDKVCPRCDTANCEFGCLNILVNAERRTRNVMVKSWGFEVNRYCFESISTAYLVCKFDKLYILWASASWSVNQDYNIIINLLRRISWIVHIKRLAQLLEFVSVYKMSVLY